jgi:hypothetical protein
MQTSLLALHQDQNLIDLQAKTTATSAAIQSQIGKKAVDPTQLSADRS